MKGYSISILIIITSIILLPTYISSNASPSEGYLSSTRSPEKETADLMELAGLPFVHPEEQSF